MTVLEPKRAIDDYIEAGGDKYCDVFVNEVLVENRVTTVFYDEREFPDGSIGGLVIL